MDKYLTRTYDRKPMKVKKHKPKKMKQSTLHACKKVVVLENLAELNMELDGIAKILLNKTSIKTTNEKHNNSNNNNKHIKNIPQKKDEENTICHGKKSHLTKIISKQPLNLLQNPPGRPPTLYEKHIKTPCKSHAIITQQILQQSSKIQSKQISNPKNLAKNPRFFFHTIL